MIMIEDTQLYAIKLTIQIALISTCIVSVIGMGIGYILATKKIKFKIILDIIITLPLILPPTVIGYYLLVLFGKHGFVGKILFNISGYSILFTKEACVLTSCIITLPLMIKSAEIAFKSIDKKLIKFSHMLGYSELTILFKIILPLSKNGLLSGIALSFCRSIGEFGASMMISGNIPGKTNTIPITIYALVMNGELGKAHTLVIIITLITIVSLYSIRMLENQFHEQ